MSKIRIATFADSVAINLLSTHLGYGKTAQNIADLRLKQVLASINDQVYVYQQDNIVIGWLHLFKAHRIASSTFYEIAGLVVAPVARNKGVARELIAFAAKSLSNIELRVRCNSQREYAHKFYEKIGFEHTKTQYVFKQHINNG
jgi:N-acetylglutamate synthase-like GNAT family acetyltransferase